MHRRCGLHSPTGLVPDLREAKMIDGPDDIEKASKALVHWFKSQEIDPSEALCVMGRTVTIILNSMEEPASRDSLRARFIEVLTATTSHKP